MLAVPHYASASVCPQLESKLQKTDSKAAQYEDKYHEAMKTVNKLKEGIQSIFNKIGTSHSRRCVCVCGVCAYARVSVNDACILALFHSFRTRQRSPLPT